jgi:hypothetical protein
MRRHCFISATSLGEEIRWMWHAQTAQGDVSGCSERESKTFEECIQDAFAHGYKHVEVPVIGNAPPVWHASAQPQAVSLPVAPREEIDDEDDDFIEEAEFAARPRDVASPAIESAEPILTAAQLTTAFLTVRT